MLRSGSFKIEENKVRDLEEMIIVSIMGNQVTSSRNVLSKWGNIRSTSNVIHRELKEGTRSLTNLEEEKLLIKYISNP